MRPRRLVFIVCVIAAVVITAAQALASSEVVLRSFPAPLQGANPSAGVIQDSTGNLYGTTSRGGTLNAGVVYKLDTAGNETVLYSFKGRADGRNPYGGVIRDSDGNIYGTTVSGGASGQGVVYKLDTRGHETVLYSFTGGADGGNPYTGVIRDAAGDLYGTTNNGGASGAGVVYMLDTTGHETVLYSFTGGADGRNPYAGVIQDSVGNLYGTTLNGGASGVGVVYKLDTTGHETVLYSFTGGGDGEYPYGGVIRDSAGNLYGTTAYGGGLDHLGVVYKLDTTGHETVLYSFTGGADGGFPRAGVIRDAAGNLYGTTEYHGDSNRGVVYKLDTAGQETVLHSFTGGTDGRTPYAGVIRDAAGNLYGTTYDADASGPGVVYKLDTVGHETLLYSFPSDADGRTPYAGVIQDSAGNLYGTTWSGGASHSGAVYKLDSTGQETLLYSFTGGADGCAPNAGVIQDSDGSLYGTTVFCGAVGEGLVYKLDTAGQETVLHSFMGGKDGDQPHAGVIRDSTGNLYGTTIGGGASAASAGMVYKLGTTGHETVLYSFTGGADGDQPYAGVIRDSAGNLYGTALGGGASGHGVVYKLDTTGHETVLYNFTGGADGAYPYAGVIQDSAGNLYGTTSQGGASNWGVVYKLDTTGHETVLYSFTGGADGAYPYAGVIRDSAGNFYGTTVDGGASGRGVVYELDTAGHETVLYSFTGAGGANPRAGVIRDSAGNLYGTTASGGASRSGVVYEITP